VDSLIEKLISFLTETIEYFLTKVNGITEDRYFADRDIRYILDKCINDIILCVVDIAEECLKQKNRSIPETYRDTILACYEFVGDIAIKVAPLVKHRNELVHQYLKVNWQNIVVVKNKIEDIRLFSEAIKKACRK